MGAVSLISASADSALAQAGTRFKRTYTFIQSGSATIDFQVVGLIEAGGATTVSLEFGPDGNDAALTTDPFPTPSAVNFALSMGGTAASGFTAAAVQSGTASPTGITGKSIVPTYSPFGRYVLNITHDSGVSSSTTETWHLVITGLPTVRAIGQIEFGTITDLIPTGACGASTPCPSVCPLGQTCKGPCPLKPCFGPYRFYRIPEFKWPPGPWPGPECLTCPPEWEANFDPGQFERILVTFLPDAQQRADLERNKDIRFNVAGGEALGEIREGGRGEFIQMVQYPKGQAPMVTVVAQGATIAEFRAERQLSEDAKLYRNLTYGLGALLVAALGGIGVMMRRQPGGPGKSGLG